MTIKLKCIKIERVWGGTAVYHFNSQESTQITLVITLSEEDPSRYDLGRSYEMTIK